MFSKVNSAFYRSFGLILMLVACLGLSAKPTASVHAQGSDQECGDCHKIIDEHWQESAHGIALTDTVFLEAWLEKDQDEDCLSCHSPNEAPGTAMADREGVSCDTCHFNDSGLHPQDIMLTNGSSRLCGECHLDTHAEWKDSVHGAENLSCTQCHNPHSTAIKGQDSLALCQSCHQDGTHSYDLTMHAEAGLICSDCHLEVAEGPMGDGHGARLHSFDVSVKTCAECHQDDLHAVEDLDFAAADAVVEEQSGPERAELLSEPASVSPLGYGVLGTLFGAGLGMVGAPWLEKWYQRFKS